MAGTVTVTIITTLRIGLPLLVILSFLFLFITCRVISHHIAPHHILSYLISYRIIIWLDITKYFTVFPPLHYTVPQHHSAPVRRTTTRTTCTSHRTDCWSAPCHPSAHAPTPKNISPPPNSPHSLPMQHQGQEQRRSLWMKSAWRNLTQKRTYLRSFAGSHWPTKGHQHQWEQRRKMKYQS